MQRYISSLLQVIAIILCFTSCERFTIPSDNEETPAKETSSLLQIRTRAAEVDEEGTVSYPVNVYVFQEEECVAVQVIENESQSLSILLPRGTGKKLWTPGFGSALLQPLRPLEE